MGRSRVKWPSVRVDTDEVFIEIRVEPSEEGDEIVQVFDFDPRPSGGNPPGGPTPKRFTLAELDALVECWAELRPEVVKD